MDKGINFRYPLNVFGSNVDTLEYPDIQNATYYGYKSRSPSHCKILSKKGTFRFNCTLEEAEKLFDFFKTMNIAVSYNDEKEVGYR